MPKPHDWPKGKKWHGRKKGPYEWYEIQDSIAYHAELSKPKILYQEIATYQSFAYDEEGIYVNNKVFLIPTDDLYLLAVLNSAIAWQYLKAICSRLEGGALAMQLPYISSLPIPHAPPLQKEKIASLAKRCLHSSELAKAKLEAEIEEMIVQLYLS